LERTGLGKGAVNYKLRDWLFSRQRYWGEPFPIVHCPTCGAVALGEDDLPLVLPELSDFTPAASDDPDAPPQPPLGRASEWVKTACPSCGGPATRELNTMPQWAGSCWYYLRFLDPSNDRAFCDPKVERYWMKPSRHLAAGQAAMGVDLYVGGAEHAVLHLLYARFWHKVLFDLGYVFTSEPFGRLFNQGMIRSFAYRDHRGVYVAYPDVDLSGDRPRHRQTGEELTESVEKMSKSLKNVVNPDEVIAQYGADTFRLYEMFMGPLEASKPWNTRDVPGVHRFLHRVWRMICGSEDSPALLRDGDINQDVELALHKLIKKVGSDIQAMKFNTAIAAMMDFVNTVYRAGTIAPDPARRFVLVLSPFAPHLAEELWQRLGGKASLSHEPWPSYDEAMLAEESIELPVQVNGKLRGRITVAADASQADIIAAALAEAKVAAAVEGKTVVKKIVVPGKLINIVIR
jgi:leucyl-tRNA synthetase